MMMLLRVTMTDAAHQDGLVVVVVVQMQGELSTAIAGQTWSRKEELCLVLGPR